MDNQRQHILVVSMLGSAEVTAVAVPLIKHLQQQLPDKQIELLTFAQGKEIADVALPDVNVIEVKKDQWPENILMAMEAFLGLAETVIGKGYEKIINLDTHFMPCFLARFLKDAGEPLEGNLISISVQDLLEQLQRRTLQPEYVNNPEAYMQSTWFSMARWHTSWWEGDYLPDNGYPEYYLRSCCGFESLEYNLSIDVDADKTLGSKKDKKVIALAIDGQSAEQPYPFGVELQQKLEEAGFEVWGSMADLPVKTLLQKLKASDLLVAMPSAYQWFAQSVGCPSLIMCGQIDPRSLMPDFATDPSHVPIPAAELFESIQSIFEQA